MDEIARTEGDVLIAITLKGADLSRNILHITTLIKIFDLRDADPLTGIMIGLEIVQSRE